MLLWEMVSYGDVPLPGLTSRDIAEAAQMRNLHHKMWVLFHMECVDLSISLKSLSLYSIAIPIFFLFISLILPPPFSLALYFSLLLSFHSSFFSSLPLPLLTHSSLLLLSMLHSPSHCPPVLCSLISQCHTHYPNLRPSFAEILNQLIHHR